MDDTVPKENPPPDFNKLDLSQLQGFSFGTQWTQDKSGKSDKREGGEPRLGRDDRRQGPGEGADRRDRRAFRKPMGGPDAGGPGGAPSDRGGPGRRPYSDERGPQSRESAPGRGGPQSASGREGSYDRNPYDSPHFATTFYPDDATFDALVKTVRASCRTIELFEIARTILGKPERFTIYVTRRTAEASSDAPQGGMSPAEAPPSGTKADQRPIFLSIPDGLPFDTEEAAIAHVLDKHLALFFEQSQVEVEPPKGNFQVINRCGVTGELLGPPNYHRYAQAMQQHHAAKLSRMSFETYRSRIETVRDPEIINQWLEKMKKVTRYTWRSGAEEVAKAEPAAEPAAAPPEAAAPVAFDSFEDARAHLLAHGRDKIVRSASHARLPGRSIDAIPAGEIRRSVEGALERQRRFPLETANALRGRLRREHFTIFKKGAKGISYVCAVKRKFRVPGQVFSENIGALIAFIEAHPLAKAGELVKNFLGITAGAAELTPEQRDKVARLNGDIQWLVHEGYVTEFIDGGLYTPAPLADARKKEAEREENDPENFPEPVAAAEPEPAPAAIPPEAPSAQAEPVPPVEGDAQV